MKSAGIFSVIISVIFGLYQFNEQSSATVRGILPVRRDDAAAVRHYYMPSGITAKGFLFYDLTKNMALTERAPEKFFPIASITKIMTALVALEYLPRDATISISKNAIETEGAAGNLYAGERFLLKDLLTIMMTESSNDAAVALAETVGKRFGEKTSRGRIRRFTELMNEKSAALGMRRTFFQNPTGLDLNGNAPSNYSTAQDLVLLVKETLKNPLIWESARDAKRIVRSLSGIRHQVAHTNPLSPFIPQLIGSKTGSTNNANESLVMIFERPLGHPLLLIILDAPPGSRVENALRFLRAHQLL